VKEDTGLVTADGQKIVSEIHEEKEAPKIGDMVDTLREQHPLQYLNMMSTNLDMMVCEYNKTAFEHGEPIIAAVFVDADEDAYLTYKGVLFPEGDAINAESEDSELQDDGDIRGETSGGAERGEG